MATQDELELLAGKTLLEPNFLQEMQADPEKAAASVGITLTPMQKEYIAHLNKDNAEAIKRAATIAQEAMGPQPITAWTGQEM